MRGPLWLGFLLIEICGLPLIRLPYEPPIVDATTCFGLTFVQSIDVTFVHIYPTRVAGDRLPADFRRIKVRDFCEVSEVAVEVMRDEIVRTPGAKVFAK